MYSVLTIIGARPQIIKAAALSRVFRKHFPDQIREYILHTGQHYDDNMSDVFFRQMQIPDPDFQLNIGSAPHGTQTGRMMEKIEEVLLKLKPHAVLVYGDTNSTLAGALAAVKVHIPLIHVEAGLRSYNKHMPEEINRIVADHASTLLFAPTHTAIRNLEKEGFALDQPPPYHVDSPGIFHSGDIMLDNTLFFSEIAEQCCQLPDGLKKGHFILCTIHRDHNTDNPHRLQRIVESLIQIAETFSLPVILPLHPRTRKNLNQRNDGFIQKAENHPFLKLTDPAGFLEMCLLEKHCRLIITDSGGVQKESFFFHKPCVILRKETEWKELIEHGTALLADDDSEKIFRAAEHFLHYPPQTFPPVFGDGSAALFISNTILEFLKYDRGAS